MKYTVRYLPDDIAIIETGDDYREQTSHAEADKFRASHIKGGMEAVKG